jgi:hypothetical protein
MQVRDRPCHANIRVRMYTTSLAMVTHGRCTYFLGCTRGSEWRWARTETRAVLCLSVCSDAGLSLFEHSLNLRMAVHCRIFSRSTSRELLNEAIVLIGHVTLLNSNNQVVLVRIEFADFDVLRPHVQLI